MYVYGREFELERDHKPLECIFGKTSKPSTIIERWVLRLHCQNFKVSYRPGKEDIVRFVAMDATPVALTTREVTIIIITLFNDLWKNVQ